MVYGKRRASIHRNLQELLYSGPIQAVLIDTNIFGKTNTNAIRDTTGIKLVPLLEFGIRIG